MKTETFNTRGGFAAGLYEGNGKEFEENGSLQYEGSFVSGLYDEQVVFMRMEN